MDPRIVAFVVVIIFVTGVGVILGYVLKSLLIMRTKNNLEERLSRMRIDTQNEIASLKSQANKEIEQQRNRAQQEIIATKQELHVQQKRLSRREEQMEKREDKLSRNEMTLEKEQSVLEADRRRTQSLLNEREQKLEALAGVSKEEAYELLLENLSEQKAQALFAMTARQEQELSEELSEQSKELVVIAMQRYANTVDNDIMSSSVKLPDDESKGKIIGKEGRNIKAFEQLSGVQLLIDDTPGAVSISSYDPIRRAVAKIALDELLKDGRIQPARIEEVLDSARASIHNTIEKKGRAAAKELGIFNLDPELLGIIGTLYYRYSFGQNVLQHSIEMGHIAGMLASELGADVAVAKAGALMHDIGKAVDHEIEGTHVEIGRKILKQYGVDESIIKAMQAHHEEYPYETIESRIVQAADAISSARPGARSDNAGLYVERLEGLEKIAQSYDGVEDAYAVSAGREVRVFVNPKEINDFQAAKLARKIAKQVKAELKFPGEIKITVIRENRTIEIAR